MGNTVCREERVSFYPELEKVLYLAYSIAPLVLFHRYGDTVIAASPAPLKIHPSGEIVELGDERDGVLRFVKRGKGYDAFLKICGSPRDIAGKAIKDIANAKMWVMYLDQLIYDMVDQVVSSADFFDSYGAADYLAHALIHIIDFNADYEKAVKMLNVFVNTVAPQELLDEISTNKHRALGVLTFLHFLGVDVSRFTKELGIDTSELERHLVTILKRNTDISLGAMVLFTIFTGEERMLELAERAASRLLKSVDFGRAMAALNYIYGKMANRRIAEKLHKIMVNNMYMYWPREDPDEALGTIAQAIAEREEERALSSRGTWSSVMESIKREYGMWTEVADSARIDIYTSGALFHEELSEVTKKTLSRVELA